MPLPCALTSVSTPFKPLPCLLLRLCALHTDPGDGSKMMAEGIGHLCDDLGVEPSDIALVRPRVTCHVSTQAPGQEPCQHMSLCVCSRASNMG
jgi:hypothetical protein